MIERAANANVNILKDESHAKFLEEVSTLEGETAIGRADVRGSQQFSTRQKHIKTT